MPLFEVKFGFPEQPKNEWARWGEDVYNNPQEANTVARQQNDRYRNYRNVYPDHKSYQYVFMIQRLSGASDFAAREEARVDYKPFEVQGQVYHFAELKGEYISFFSTAARAEDNIRDEMKLGRYLRRYTELSDNEIADICARNGVQCGDMDVKFATTREEIARVYAKGPRSCMASERDDWDGGVHPTEAYASPDLAIAYIIRDDRITARTLVVPAKKKWICIYGDSLRLSAKLIELGYSCDEEDGPDQALEGCRLLRIDTGVDDHYACPYIDGDVYVASEDSDNDYFYLRHDRGSSWGEHGYVRDRDTDRGRKVSYDPYDDEAREYD